MMTSLAGFGRTAILLLSAMLAFNVFADVNKDLAAAQKQLAAGGYESAYRQFQQIEKKTAHPLAQFTLALFYEYGWARPVDRVKACDWYAKAAQGSVPAAQHFYANCLAEGVSGQADGQKALHWYQQAVNSGHVISLCNMADLYIYGQLVPRDIKRGLQLCRNAAEQGLSQAMVKLGAWYLRDDEKLRNYNQAFYWLKQAAEMRHPEGQFLLAVMHRDGLDRPVEQEKARYWFESAASQGYLAAYFQTGKLYFYAPVDPVVKKLHPDHLAKAYLWLSATLQRSQVQTERAESKKLLAKIAQDMPASWLPELDKKLAAHLAQFKRP